MIESMEKYKDTTEAVGNLFGSLALIYPKKFMYCKEMEEVKRIKLMWVLHLKAFTVEQIMDGIKLIPRHFPKFPPELGEYVQMLNQQRRPELDVGDQLKKLDAPVWDDRFKARMATILIFKNRRLNAIGMVTSDVNIIYKGDFPVKKIADDVILTSDTQGDFETLIRNFTKAWNEYES